MIQNNGFERFLCTDKLMLFIFIHKIILIRILALHFMNVSITIILFAKYRIIKIEINETIIITNSTTTRYSFILIVLLLYIYFW